MCGGGGRLDGSSSCVTVSRQVTSWQADRRPRRWTYACAFATRPPVSALPRRRCSTVLPRSTSGQLHRRHPRSVTLSYQQFYFRDVFLSSFAFHLRGFPVLAGLFPFHFRSFLRRVNLASYARAVLSSACLSVCLSVRLSHVCQND